MFTQIKEEPSGDPTIMKPIAKKGRKAKITLQHLLLGTSAKFSAIYILLIKAYYGILPAWGNPDVGIFKRHWANVYGTTEAGGWEKDDPVRVLVSPITISESLLTNFYQISYRLESWHNGFAQHAMKAVNMLVTCTFATKEERTGFVKECLGTKLANRPFYWKQPKVGKRLVCTPLLLPDIHDNEKSISFFNWMLSPTLYLPTTRISGMLVPLCSRLNPLGL
jgi:hypothetical protein